MTVVPYTVFASVMYSASLAVGDPAEATGTPRELNSIHAVLSIKLPGLPPATPVVHGAACAITVWGFDPHGPVFPVPKLTPEESDCTGLATDVQPFAAASPSVFQQPAVLSQVSN